MTGILDRKHSRTSFLTEVGDDGATISEKEFSRNLFLKGSGAVVVGLSAAGAAQALNVPNHPNPQKTGFKERGPGATSAIDSWIHVHSNNTVSIYDGRTEFGHGTPTAVSMAVAEEMNLAVSQVKHVQPDTWTTMAPGSFSSSGTTGSLNGTGNTTIRGAAAAARVAMLRMAAAQWGRDVSELRVSWGVISVPGTGLRTTYGALMGGKLFRNNTAQGLFNANQLGATTIANVNSPGGSVVVKPTSQHKVLGTRVPLIHVPAIVSGKEIYIQQLKIPGMVHGRVVRPRGQAAIGYGAKIDTFDASSVKHIPGVQVVRHNNFLGVVAPKEYDAIQAAAQLKVKWDNTPTMSSSGALEKAFKNPANHVNTPGNFTPASQTALWNAVGTKKLSFFVPYQGHFPMAPNAAIAHIHPQHNANGTLLSNKFLTLYSFGEGTAEGLSDAGPAATAIDPVTYPTNWQNTRARGIWYPASGTYGQSLFMEAAGAATALAVLSGKPVRMVFMRWDEHGWQYTGIPQAAEMEWGVDAQGKLVGGQTRAWGHGNAGSQVQLRPTRDLLAATNSFTNSGNWGGPNPSNTGGYYTFPNHSRVTHSVQARYQASTGVGFLKTTYFRAPNEYEGAFMGEQMIDEMAILAKMDPIAFRKLNLTNNAAGNRWRAVLSAVAAAAKWKPAVSGSNIQPGVVATGRGVGIGSHGATTPAVVADVTVNRRTGKVDVRHLYGAQDVGYAYNPEGVHSQSVGMMVQGASRAMHEEVRFNKVRVTSQDWVSYPILRFKDTPKTTSVLLQRKDLGASGAGEPLHVPTGAAIANAIYDATGVRMTRLPFTPAYIRSMLRKHGVGPTG